MCVLMHRVTPNVSTRYYGLLPSQSPALVFSQEGDTINVDVTCPGATLALAMIYLKTNNRY